MSHAIALTALNVARDQVARDITLPDDTARDRVEDMAVGILGDTIDLEMLTAEEEDMVTRAAHILARIGWACDRRRDMAAWAE